MPPHGTTRYPQLRDVQWLTAQRDAGRTTKAIARELGCSTGFVRRAASVLGVSFRQTRKHHQLYDADYLHQRYVVDQLSHRQLTAEIGCTPGILTAALKRYGLSRTNRVKYPQVWDRDYLHQRYVTERVTRKQLAAEIGCSPEYLKNVLERHELTWQRW